MSAITTCNSTATRNSAMSAGSSLPSWLLSLPSSMSLATPRHVFAPSSDSRSSGGRQQTALSKAQLESWGHADDLARGLNALRRHDFPEHELLRRLETEAGLTADRWTDGDMLDTRRCISQEVGELLSSQGIDPDVMSKDFQGLPDDEGFYGPRARGVRPLTRQSGGGSSLPTRSRRTSQKTYGDAQLTKLQTMRGINALSQSGFKVDTLFQDLKGWAVKTLEAEQTVPPQHSAADDTSFNSSRDCDLCSARWDLQLYTRMAQGMSEILGDHGIDASVMTAGTKASTTRLSKL